MFGALLTIADTISCSGEIDIAETRGNGPEYKGNGRNTISSSFHWGPSSMFDRWQKTTGLIRDRRKTYADGFHKYGLEWTEDYIMICE